MRQEKLLVGMHWLLMEKLCHCQRTYGRIICSFAEGGRDKERERERKRVERGGERE